MSPSGHNVKCSCFHLPRVRNRTATVTTPCTVAQSVVFADRDVGSGHPGAPLAPAPARRLRTPAPVVLCLPHSAVQGISSVTSLLKEYLPSFGKAVVLTVGLQPSALHYPSRKILAANGGVQAPSGSVKPVLSLDQPPVKMRLPQGSQHGW